MKALVRWWDRHEHRVPWPIRTGLCVAYALFLLCAGCASGSWQWFDAGVTPPRDALWMSAGATMDAGLQFAKLPTIPRYAADITASIIVRTTSCCGRNLDSGFDLLFGAAVTTLGGFVLRHR